MEFDVAGPFELTRHGKKDLITKQSLKDLKAETEKWEAGLTSACGCYVFAAQAGKGLTPYYVGQSCKRGLVVEALDPANRAKYNEVLSERKGTPVLFLIPMRTPGGKFRKPKKADGTLSAVDFLERYLIYMAIEKNSDLMNTHETRFMRDLHVTGIFNAEKGEGTKASQLLRKTLW